MAILEPPHPGYLVRRECLKAFDLSVIEGARMLGVTRQALNNVVTGRARISPEMAVRLDKAFGGGAETWLHRQLDYDLALVRKRAHTLKVHPISERPGESQPRLL
jgi:addiction module HigA family antidote